MSRALAMNNWGRGIIDGCGGKARYIREGGIARTKLGDGSGDNVTGMILGM